MYLCGVCTWLCVPKFMVARGWHLVSSLSFEMETPTSEVKGFSSLCLPSVRITDAAHHTQLLLDATALSSHFQTITWSDVPSLPPLKNVYAFLFPCCFHNFILLFYFFLAFFHLTVFSASLFWPLPLYHSFTISTFTLILPNFEYVVCS